ncbi:DUF262 domain-containing protein [Erysipelothrix anatis]|uniref:DUF262 domain-containing protein n=1 Tax=Erysipelothrix anatis TaxID=2683713 RepID=UPI0013579252|nr:DUF262 domain-containing protein [Erysipelothrix anatis]
MANKQLVPHNESLADLFKNVFSIPVYQRPYKWESVQIDELISDTLSYLETNEMFYSGTIYLSNSGQLNSSTNQYDIVDGQQRITTYTLLLLSLYSHANRLNIQEETDIRIIKDFLWKREGRYNNKDHTVLKASNMESRLVRELFDSCYSQPSKYSELLMLIKPNNVIEEKYLKNVIHIDKLLTSRLNSLNVEQQGNFIISFSNFILNNVFFITITVGKDNLSQMFDIFESINSKGIGLSEIDLIKSYIFQNLQLSDYDEYLNKWGQLIDGTDDRLFDYLSVFIRANIRYYVNAIKYQSFKLMSSRELSRYYNTSQVDVALKKLIDDLIKNIDLYNKLITKNIYLINSDEFRYYTNSLRYFSYEHPKALLFRTYCEYNEGIISKKQVISVVRNSFNFMFRFLTLKNRDSKDIIPIFKEITESTHILDEKTFNHTSIIDLFILNANRNGFTDDAAFQRELEEHIGYSNEKEKNETRILLSAFEFSFGSNPDYSKMNLFLENTKAIQIDHILVRNPDKNDSNFQYWKEKKDSFETLRLKQDSDFEVDGIYDGVDWTIFENKVLDKIGNLRLSWKKENQSRSNTLLTLDNYGELKTYKQISNRGKDIASKLVEIKIFDIK